MGLTPSWNKANFLCVLNRRRGIRLGRQVPIQQSLGIILFVEFGRKASIFMFSITLTILFIVLIRLALVRIRRILASPFRYPYDVIRFDVSGKRNVRIEDYIDRYLIDSENWRNIIAHHACVQRWKQKQEEYLETCRLQRRRRRQYAESIDDFHEFCFITQRSHTCYKQSNNVITPYKEFVDDSSIRVSWQWVIERRNRLAAINDEATLNEYHARNQRKIMTKQLREQIARRDNYTCQICGKYMPDGVGLQIDHIVPVSKGGKSVPSNLQVLCSKCNGRKGAR